MLPLRAATTLDCGKGFMAADTCDILKRHVDGSFIWIESARDIEVAKTRLGELSAATPGEYFVFDQKTQQLFVTLSNRPDS
jgi:hypothetical protein